MDGTGLRVRITLHGEARLPFNYREGLQGAIYTLLGPELGGWLHDEGVVVRGKHLKLFVFSRLLGLRFDAGQFKVDGDAHFYFATAFSEVASALVTRLWAQGEMELYGQLLKLRFMEILPPIPNGGEIKVGAYAPITAYRTLGKKTLFFNPLNKEFGEILEANLNLKAKALGLEGGRLEVQPLGLRERDKKVERYKGTWVEGWMGQYLLKGSPHLIRLALLTGLGAKNSQGFGFVKEV